MNATHAYLALSTDIKTSAIPEAIKNESPDVRHIVKESFTIDDARSLKEASIERPFSGEHHYFVIGTKSITSEAQNAILKLFEDPPAGAVFYLVIPSEASLLPTLKSRLLKVDVIPSGDGKNNLADTFIHSSYKDRLDWIADKAKKDPAALQDLTRELGQHIDENNWPVATKRALLTAMKYMYNRGAAKKMLLEEVALSLPINK